MKIANMTLFLLPFVISAVLSFIVSAPGLAFIVTYFVILGMVIGTFVLLDFLKLYWHSRKYRVHSPSEKPQIYKTAVVITTFNEDPDMVLDTALSAKLAIGEMGDVFVLDDSTDGETRRSIDKLEDHGINIERRGSRRGYKAGAVNDWLKTHGGKYDLLAIFDADQRPLPFLFKSVNQYFADEKIAFVQIPQYYSEVSTAVSLGAFFQQLPFLRLVMKGRSRVNSAFSLGSGTIYRVKHLSDIGGLDESTVTEDISTALDLHSKELKSVYVDKPLIWFGMPPKNIAAYWIQQGRWSLGGFQLLPKLLKAKLSAEQFFDYLNGWLYWFTVGPITFFELLAPFIFLMLGVSFFRFDPMIYLTAYIPYFLASIAMYLFMVKKHKYGLRGFIYHHTVQLLAFVPVAFSFASWLTRKKKPFAVTPKSESTKTPRGILMVFTAITSLLALSTIKGVVDLATGRAFSWAAHSINIFWAAYFAAFFTFGLYVILRRKPYPETLRAQLKPSYLVENEKEEVLSSVQGAIQLERLISDLYLEIAQKLAGKDSAILKRISRDSAIHAEMFRSILDSVNCTENPVQSKGLFKTYYTVLQDYSSAIPQDLDDEKTLEILQLFLDVERYVNEEAYITLLSRMFEETLLRASDRFEDNRRILESIRNDEEKHVELITTLRNSYLQTCDMDVLIPKPREIHLK